MTQTATLPDQGHVASKFDAYGRAGFLEDLLPLIRVDATIHAESPGHDALIEKRGKVPGRKRRGGWFGFPDWTNYITTVSDLPVWEGWGAGIGMQGRRFPALDIDIHDGELANAVEELAQSVLGAAPCRFGRAPRRLLVYAAPDLTRRKVEIQRRPDNADVSTTLTDTPTSPPKAQAVEFLATGQHYVVEGIHPTTMLPYVWRDEQSLASVGAAGLTQISTALLDRFYAQLDLLFDLYGYDVIARSARADGNHRRSAKPLRAPSVAAIGRALSALPNEFDYYTWLKVGMAVKGSAGPESEAEAFEHFMTWSLLWPDNTPEAVEEKWRSFTNPAVGWDFLANFATEHAGGAFHGAHEDFDAIEPAPVPGQESKGPLVNDATQAMFDRYIWVERLQRACDLQTGELLNREWFNVRNNHIGDPSSSKDCAWATFQRNWQRLQTVASVTYRPGADLFVTEKLAGLVGRCVNQWRPPATSLPAVATDADVEKWLDHMKVVIPNRDEREIVLNWLAWIIQNPGEKPNWAILIGSTWEGVGKDLLLQPVRVALGADNVREIGAGELMSGFTWWVANTRLVIVQEMHSFERKETMNRLKPLIAAPPETLTINKKHERQYEVPNIIASVFFTNMDNALQVSKQDRRFFITWNDDRPRDKAYYAELVRWYEAGGAALAARWLQLRDVTGFDAKGRAPHTEAKLAMQKAGRSLIDEIIEDGLADHDQALAHSVFTLDEVADMIARRLGDRHRPTNNRVVSTLSRNGCRKVARLALGEPPTGSYGPNCGKRMYTVFARAADADGLVTMDEVRAAYFATRLKTDPFS